MPKPSTTFVRAGVVAVTTVLAACNLPLVLQPETIFRATFGADAVNSPPGSPEVGTWWLVDATDGTILVRSSIGNLPGKAVELTSFGPAPGSPAMSGSFAGNPVTSGRLVARWRSLVHSQSFEFAATSFSGGGGVVAVVSHRRQGQITLNGQTNVVGSWTLDVARTFELSIDMGTRTTSLKIDGIPAPGAQDVPFQSATGPAIFDRLDFAMGGTHPDVHAWSDIEVRVWR